MTAILAILVDSYRELIAKKLFWFVLAISWLIVVSYGSIGFNQTGVSIGYGLHTFEQELLTEEAPLVKPFLDTLFSTFIVGLWLAWGAIILALLSTAEIFPNFLSSGSIDLVLSKPIRRPTVFLTKYIGSLLFVLLQVAIFSIGILIVLRLRIGEWRWPVLLAIPIIVLVFSYLYSIMVLMSVITRSTLVSLLVTFIVWVGLFTLHTTEGMIAFIMVVAHEVERDRLQERIEWYDTYIPRDIEAGNLERAQRKQEARAELQEDLDDTLEKLHQGENVHRIARWTVFLLPKTSSTSDLLARRLAQDTGMTSTDVFAILSGNEEQASIATGDQYAESPPMGQNNQDWEMDRRMEKREMSKTPAFIIGTSLAFEAVVVTIALIIFSRREW